MPLNNLLSLAAVIVMAIAFWCGGLYLESNIVFVLQIIGYALWAASSWLIGVRSAVLAFAICAVTLVLKVFRRHRPRIMLPFLVLTLVGGLIVNNSGWMGVLPILAGMEVVYVRPFKQWDHFPLFFFPKEDWEDIRKHGWIVLPQMDNALRLSAHAIDVFLDNIIGVTLWGAYAWAAGDMYMFFWRCIMLAINLLDFSKRIWPVLSGILSDMLPDPNGRKRRILPGQRRRRRWVI